MVEPVPGNQGVRRSNAALGKNYPALNAVQLVKRLRVELGTLFIIYNDCKIADKNWGILILLKNNEKKTN